MLGAQEIGACSTSKSAGSGPGSRESTEWAVTWAKGGTHQRCTAWEDRSGGLSTPAAHHIIGELSLVTHRAAFSAQGRASRTFRIRLDAMATGCPGCPGTAYTDDSPEDGQKERTALPSGGETTHVQQACADCTAYLHRAGTIEKAESLATVF